MVELCFSPRYHVWLQSHKDRFMISKTIHSLEYIKIIYHDHGSDTVQASVKYWCFAVLCGRCITDSIFCEISACFRADFRFAPSQWETALLCNDVSHWLGASLESTPCFRADTTTAKLLITNKVSRCDPTLGGESRAENYASSKIPQWSYR